MKKFFSLLLATGFVAFSFCRAASAQFLVEQAKIKQIVTPGQAFSGSITVHNLTDDRLDVSAYLEDFEYVEPFNGEKEFYPAGTLNRSAARWINFEPRQFSLRARSRQQINYTVNVPREASGGHYSVLFFERSDAAQAIEGRAGLRIISRVGSLLFFETQQRRKKLDLIDTELSSTGTLTLTMKNSGDVNLVVQCYYYVLDERGVPADRGQMDPFYFSENSQTDAELALHSNISPGRYTAVLTFDLEDGASSVHEINFTVDHAGVFRKN